MISASLELPMERCDASILVGGCDVWSGECGPGGRYAGPAVSPRQLHRWTQHKQRQLGRRLYRWPRFSWRGGYGLHQFRPGLARQALEQSRSGIAVQHLEMAVGWQGPYAKQRLRRVRRLQLAVDRSRRRHRAEL